MNVNTLVAVPIGNNDTVLKVVPDPFMSTLSIGWGIVIGSTILAIIVTGVCLNSLVLWTLVGLIAGKHRRCNTDYYIMALATADLLVLIVCYPFMFVSTISRQWLFGELGCAINGFFGFLFSLIDIGVLTMMSVLRLLCVKMPHSAFIKSPRYTVISLLVVIVYALVWTVPPLLGWGHFAPEPFGTSCTVNWKHPDRRYVTAVFLCVLALPLLVMVLCYSTIVYHMRVTSAKLGSCLAESKGRTQRQNRLVRMAVMMCVCFMVIWAPYAVLSICSSYIPKFEVTAVQSAIPTVLAKLSHVANPLICFVLNQSYRRRLKFWFLKRFISKLPDLQASTSCRNTNARAAGEIAEHATYFSANACLSRDPSLSPSLSPSLNASMFMSLRVVSKTKLRSKSTKIVFGHLRKENSDNNKKKHNGETIYDDTGSVNEFQINNETNFTDILNEEQSTCADSVGSSSLPEEKTNHLIEKATHTKDIICAIQNEHVNTMLWGQFQDKNSTPKVGSKCECSGNEPGLKLVTRPFFRTSQSAPTFVGCL